MKHIDPIHLNVMLDAVHEYEISLIQCLTVATTWNKDFF